jgi:hypothetical protein
MRGTSIIGLLLAVAVTAALFGTAWLIVQGISSGQWIEVVRWVALALLTGLLVARLVIRIMKRRAGDA